MGFYVNTIRFVLWDIGLEICPMTHWEGNHTSNQIYLNKYVKFSWKTGHAALPP